MGSWKRAAVDPAGNVVCYSSGNKCYSMVAPAQLADVFEDVFIVPDTGNPNYNQALAEASDKINQLLREAHGKIQDTNAHLCLLTTNRGMVLIACRGDFEEIPEDNDEELARILGI